MIDGQEIKLSSYADDGNFLTANVQSLNLIFNTCGTFEHFPSLKLNLEKSLGSARGKANKPVNCKWIDLNTDKLEHWVCTTAMILTWLTNVTSSLLLIT